MLLISNEIKNSIKEFNVTIFNKYNLKADLKTSFINKSFYIYLEGFSDFYLYSQEFKNFEDLEFHLNKYKNLILENDDESQFRLFILRSFGTQCIVTDGAKLFLNNIIQILVKLYGGGINFLDDDDQERCAILTYLVVPIAQFFIRMNVKDLVQTQVKKNIDCSDEESESILALLFPVSYENLDSEKIEILLHNYTTYAGCPNGYFERFLNQIV
jgi:hypothetical protein